MRLWQARNSYSIESELLNHFAIFLKLLWLLVYPAKIICYSVLSYEHNSKCGCLVVLFYMKAFVELHIYKS